MRYIFLLLLFCCSLAQAQQPFAKDWWLNETNTPVKVNDMVQDRLGYIWLGTDNGLYMFNGRKIVPVADKVRKPVTAVAYGDKHVYVGFSNGTVGFVDGDHITTIIIKNQSPVSAINSIYADGSKGLMLCTETGLYAVLNNVGMQISRANGLSDNFVYQVAVLPGKKLLAVTDIGINQVSFSGNKMNVDAITGADGLPDNIVRVIKKAPGKDWYWVGMQQAGVAFYSPASKAVWQPELNQPWAWGQVNDILPVDGKRTWVCTENGYLLEMIMRDSNNLEVRPIFFKDKKLKKLVCGPSGIIWCATSQGMTVVSEEYMSHMELNAPYKLSAIRAMSSDKHNILWFAQGRNLYKVPLGVSVASPQLVLSMPVDITCLYVDKETRVWIGTFGQGLWYKEEGAPLTHVSDVPDLYNESILDVTGTDDRLWVSGLNGVEELSYPSTYTRKILLLRKHKKDSGIGSDYVYQLFPDRKNRIWMATDGAGVRMYDEGRYRKWDATSGLNSKVIYNVTQDGFGNIWVVSLYGGLYRFNGDRWEQISREQGLQDVNISTIAANATGQVIAVHAKGIDVWYPSSKQFRNYNTRQGFGVDSSSAVLKLAAKDTSGNVYIPYERGFVIFKNIDRPYDIRPVVNLSSISVYFKPVHFGKKDFDYDQNHISFSYDGVNFANPERLRYRYKLDGYNDSWIVTNDESVTFPQLTTGKYKFRIQASLNNSFSSYGEASYDFTVAKPFWFRTWFILLAAAVILGIAYMYILMREKNLRKVTSLQRERMVFEYEHLKSQVNPHFLFNSLNTLANLIDENANAAIDYTVRLSDLYRNMLSYRDKDLILLSEEWEILENYLYIQKSRFGDALQMNVNIPDILRHTRKIVPLALQLLVENAIKHNVVSKAKPLTITITATHDTITISNPIRPKLSKEKGAGLGLVNVRKRYSLLSKKQIYFGTNNNAFIVKLPLI